MCVPVRGFPPYRGGRRPPEWSGPRNGGDPGDPGGWPKGGPPRGEVSHRLRSPLKESKMRSTRSTSIPFPRKRPAASRRCRGAGCYTLSETRIPPPIAAGRSNLVEAGRLEPDAQRVRRPGASPAGRPPPVDSNPTAERTGVRLRRGQRQGDRCGSRRKAFRSFFAQRRPKGSEWAFRSCARAFHAETAGPGRSHALERTVFKLVVPAAAARSGAVSDQGIIPRASEFV